MMTKSQMQDEVNRNGVLCGGEDGPPIDLTEEVRILLDIASFVDHGDLRGALGRLREWRVLCSDSEAKGS